MADKSKWVRRGVWVSWGGRTFEWIELLREVEDLLSGHSGRLGDEAGHYG